MDSLITVGLRTLVNNVFELLSNTKSENASIIKINSEHLLTNGELCFIANLQAWKSFLVDQPNHVSEYTNILEYLLHSHEIVFEEGTDRKISEKAFELLISASSSWPLKIQRCTLQKERICIFLNRPLVLAAAIKAAINLGTNYGKKISAGKTFRLKVHSDEESELTNLRLHLVKDVSESVLRLRGCEISDDNDCHKYIVTIKSQGKIEENYHRYVCGVVKSVESNAKETSLTWKSYLNKKMEELLESSKQKFPAVERENESYDLFVRDIAKAVITFELLAVRPSRTVFVGPGQNSGRSVTNTKGAAFVLYNTARIATILQRYAKEESIGNYPDLTNINEVNFSLLDQEEEWELLYVFILGYPEMIQGCIRDETGFESCPQNICLFLSRLCQKFSMYYHRIRILTEGRDHLIPTMSARLYLLKALQVILHNALALLNITPVTHM